MADAQSLSNQMQALLQMMQTVVSRLEALELAVSGQAAASGQPQTAASVAASGQPQTAASPPVAAFGQPQTAAALPVAAFGQPQTAASPPSAASSSAASAGAATAQMPPGLDAGTLALCDPDEDDVDLRDAWWRDFLSLPSVWTQKGDSRWCNVCGKWDGYGHVRTPKHEKYARLWEKYHHLMHRLQ